jgi:Asp-tRNA(Asn)/Glu-tRNA(Gln) amidotransferase C subunit
MSNSPKNQNQIDVDTIKKVGHLGRIFSAKYSQNNPQQLSKYVSSLIGIMNYVDNLCTIDASEYSPFDSIQKVRINDLRPDTPDTSDAYQNVRQNIINNFPKKQGDFLQLPIRIIESS